MDCGFFCSNQGGITFESQLFYLKNETENLNIPKNKFICFKISCPTTDGLVGSGNEISADN
jgi:hypothetical protein